MIFAHTKSAADIALGDTVRICEHDEPGTVVTRQRTTHNGVECVLLGTTAGEGVIWHYVHPDHTVWVP